ncbi:uncharacterized protein LOC134300283 [Trichomycterus rosablanca]|uniref:uncharacterized protein LOC134300283 n=1 Tax=Trichomycterus rosablanca TaxID=2290929 RepID=UPI002F35A8D5
MPTFTIISSNTAVLPGESVQFKCTTPNPTCIPVDFRLYKSGTVIMKQTAESTTSFSFTVDASHPGQYSCDYTYGQINTTSARSASITITLVNLEEPKISFSSSDGWFQPIVTKGTSFSIICTTAPQYQGGSFHLKFSGSDIISTETAVNHSATFFFPEVDYVHQGNYTCSYEVTVSSRSFYSTTESLTITVKASLVPFIGLGATAGLLLLLVPVIIYCVMRRKHKSQIDKKSENKKRPSNTYVDPQNQNESDDDYENQETIFYNKNASEDSDEIYCNVDDDKEKREMDNTQTFLHKTEDSEDSDDDYCNIEDEKKTAIDNTVDSEGSDDDYINADEIQKPISMRRI